MNKKINVKKISFGVFIILSIPLFLYFLFPSQISVLLGDVGNEMSGLATLLLFFWMIAIWIGAGAVWITASTLEHSVNTGDKYINKAWLFLPLIMLLCFIYMLFDF